MKLGGSMARKRSSSSTPSPKKRKARVRVDRSGWFRGLGLGVAVVLGGGLLGYGVASRIIFPAPAPPDDLVVVPGLVGQTTEAVLEAIAEVGLDVSSLDSVSHPSIPPGVLLGQTPVDGQLARAGTGMALTVSRGPEMGPVPELDRLPFDRALALVEVGGFTLTIDSADSQLAKGTVVSVEPRPGTMLPLPSELMVAVSRGPSLIEMPLILGMQQGRAEALLDSLGLDRGETETRFMFGLDQGRVVEQEPAAGTMVEPGSEVKVVAGRRGRGGGNK